MKEFGGEMFEGRVLAKEMVKTTEKGKTVRRYEYRIKYSDGDSEHLSPTAVADLLIN